MPVKVSVLMTAYNRAGYIGEAIESVLASSFTNFELIIVDDKSTDTTVEIAKRYAEQDSRIKVYVNEMNLGDYFNRNKAASYAEGKYLKYLDADDIIYPHGLEVMVSAMEKFPQADFGTQYHLREYDLPYPVMVDSRKAFWEHFFGNSFFQSGPTGTIFKKHAFWELGGFSGRRYIGDTELWMKFSLKSPIILFQPALIWWRKHPDQEFQLGQANDGYLKLNHLLFNEIINLKILPLTQLEKEKAIQNYKIKIVRQFLAELIKRKNYKNARFIYKNCNISLKDIFILKKILLRNKL